MLKKNRPPKEIDEVSLQDRLLTSILAPVAFNLSILIVVAMFFRRSRFLGKYLFYQAHWSGSLVFVVAVLVPAVAGFVMGTSRFATLLGHFFFTNMEHEKDLFKTLAAWLALFFIAYLLCGIV